MHSRGFWLRIIYALCLSGATANHLRVLLRYGWWRDGLPLGTAIFWDSLTLLDPLAALMLFIRPRAGIGLTVAIIISDVVHNLWFEAAHHRTGLFIKDMAPSFLIMSQIAFLLFVAITSRTAWREAEKRTSIK